MEKETRDSLIFGVILGLAILVIIWFSYTEGIQEGFDLGVKESAPARAVLYLSLQSCEQDLNLMTNAQKWFILGLASQKIVDKVFLDLNISYENVNAKDLSALMSSSCNMNYEDSKRIFNEIIKRNQVDTNTV